MTSYRITTLRNLKPLRLSGNGWWRIWTRRQNHGGSDPDAKVALWKRAWLEGARAQWAGQSDQVCPYETSPGLDAWHAGWHWAKDNPDRRKASPSMQRIAHPHRRATDRPVPVSRRMKVGAVGIVLFGISAALRKLARRAGTRVPAP